MEQKSYEELLAEVLERIPDDADKREGSLIYTAVAPVCAELAQAYIRLAGDVDLLFYDTSEGEYLERLAAGSGVFREEAKAAVCKGVLKNGSGGILVPPVGMRFGCGECFYRVSGILEDGCELLCETAGSIGNVSNGTLLPVDYLEGLASAEIVSLLSAGRDAESDEALRQRLVSRVKAPAFGGNIADYRQRSKEVEGVGAVKVTPAANGGGTVKLTILGENFQPAAAAVVSRLQAVADPEEGIGFAPIGHQVTVEAAGSKTINLTASVTVQSGADKEALKASLKALVEGYFLELRQKWEDSGKTVVRLSQVTMRLLEGEGVLDVSGVTLNGAAVNVETGELEVPVLGQVSLTME